MEELNLTKIYEQKFNELYKKLASKDLPLSEIIECIEECVKFELLYEENWEAENWEEANAEKANFWFIDIHKDKRFQMSYSDQDNIFNNFLSYIIDSKEKDKEINSTIISFIFESLQWSDIEITESEIEWLFKNFPDGVRQLSSQFCLFEETPDYIFDQLLIYVNSSRDFARDFNKFQALSSFIITPKSLRRARALLIYPSSDQICEDLALSEFTQKELLYILQDNHEESTIGNPDLSKPYYTISELATNNLNSRRNQR
jgi:hypothetical protein